MPWVASRENLEYVTDEEGDGDGQKRRKERDEFIPGRVEGLPTREEVLKWYSEVVGWDPKEFSDYGDAFTMFRVTSQNSKYNTWSMISNQTLTRGPRLPSPMPLFQMLILISQTAVISQGIAARYAVRQASSAKAVEYGKQFPQYANCAWQIVSKNKAKL